MSVLREVSRATGFNASQICSVTVCTALAVFASLAGACGSDPPVSSDTDMDDVGADTEDVAVDPGTDPGVDVEVDVEPDIVDDTTDVSDEDATTEVCPDSLLCLDERTGRPSSAVCTANGYPSGTTCIAESETVACCVAPFACESDDECEATRDDSDYCLDPRYPCVCVPATGECIHGLCSANSDCAEGELCADGLCEDEPDAATFIARILTPSGFVADGSVQQLRAVAVEVGNPNVTHSDADITWTIDSGDAATISADGILSGTADVGEVVIRAQVTDNADDTGDTVIFNGLGTAAVDTTVDIYFVDETTGQPIDGALVVLTDASGTTEATTGIDGDVTFTADPPYDVHVFAEDHQYVSVLQSNTRQALIAVPLFQRAQIDEVRDGFVCDGDGVIDDTDNCGGDDQPPCLCYDLHNLDVVKGIADFTAVPNVGELEVALAGFALGNSLLDLNFDLLIGPNIDRLFPPGSPIALDEPAEIPSGVTLGFNGAAIVDSFIATAPAGERTAWSIGGVISLSDNPNLIGDIAAAAGGATDIGRIIAAVLPLFADFYSGVSTGIEMSDSPTFPVRDPQLALTVPTQRRMTIIPSALPELSSGWADTGVFLTGVLVPGEGFVPLGITAAVDDSGDGDTADGILDGDTSTLDVIDPIQISTATIHSGLDVPGAQYMIASLALVVSGNASGDTTSGQLIVFPPGEPLPEVLDLSANAYPDFALGSTWAADTRTVSIAAQSDDTDAYRLVFKGDGGQTWIVYAPDSLTEFVMPDLSTFGDGTLADHAFSGDANVVAINMGDLTLDELVRPTGRDMSNLFESVEEFSIIGLE